MSPGAHNRLRRQLIAILLFAMLVRAGLPVGYMPGRTANGDFAMVVCTALGMRADSTGNNASQPGSPHVPQVSSEHCAFAMAAGLAGPPAPLRTPLRTAVKATPDLPTITVRGFVAAIVRTQGSRAPPA